MKKTKIILIIVLGISLLVGLRFLLHSYPTAHIQVINQSSQEIENMKIALCTEAVSLNKIAPQANQTAKLKIKKDCGYDISVQFSSGKNLSADIGNVKPVSDIQETFTVTDTEILMSLKLQDQ